MKPNKWRVWPMLMSLAFLSMMPMEILTAGPHILAIVMVSAMLSFELCGG